MVGSLQAQSQCAASSRTRSRELPLEYRAANPIDLQRSRVPSAGIHRRRPRRPCARLAVRRAARRHRVGVPSTRRLRNVDRAHRARHHLAWATAGRRGPRRERRRTWRRRGPRGAVRFGPGSGRLCAAWSSRHFATPHVWGRRGCRSDSSDEAPCRAVLAHSRGTRCCRPRRAAHACREPPSVTPGSRARRCGSILCAISTWSCSRNRVHPARPADCDDALRTPAAHRYTTPSSRRSRDEPGRPDGADVYWRVDSPRRHAAWTPPVPRGRRTG